MSTKLPVISGKNLIKFLAQHGWQKDRQKGSHVILIRPDYHNPFCDELTIPLHETIKRGTLKNILRDANISTADFMAYFL